MNAPTRDPLFDAAWLPTRTSTGLVLLLAGFGLVAWGCDDTGNDPGDQNFNEFQNPPEIFDPPDASGGGSYGGTGMTPDMSEDVVEVVVPECNEFTFEYTDPAATAVLVTGSFNGWATTAAEGALELESDGAGAFSSTTLIEPPGRHQYRFLVDGESRLDPSTNRKRFNGLDGYDSELVVCEDTGPPCNQLEFFYEDATATSVWMSGSWLADDTGAWPTTPAEGAVEFTNDGTGTWSATIDMGEGLVLYKLILDGGAQWIAHPSNPDQIDDGFGGFNSVVDVCAGEFEACGDLEAFDWRDAVMYFAMIDRFEDGDGTVDPVPNASGGDADNGPSGQYEGGDLLGATNRLPYLADLGITAVWLSAPYDNRDTAGAAIDPGADPHLYSGYHGYWPSPANVDYSNFASPSPRPLIESRIGDEADLRAFIDAAHGADSADGHGMKVLFDYVMNHVDSESGLYQAHPDWFAEANGETVLCAGNAVCADTGGVCWDHPVWTEKCAFTNYLPPFDFDNAQARAWSVNDAMWWAQEFGIDGYRLDAIKHVPKQWLRDLRARLNSDITDPAGGRFYLVGETFAYDNAGLIRDFIDPATMLDGQFDFPFKARLCEAAFQSGNGGWTDFENWMRTNDRFYPDGTVMTTWIGNHDIPRPIHFASREITNCREGSNPSNGWDWQPAQPGGPESYERLGVAFAVMFTNPGIPLLYYGDEIGLAGGGDPDNRRMMPGDPDDLDAGLNVHQIALRDRVTELGRIRAENKVLGRGQRITESVSADTWVYRMTGCGGADVLVALNRADSAQSVTMPAGRWLDLRDGDAAVMGGTVSIPPRGYLIWRAE